MKTITQLNEYCKQKNKSIRFDNQGHVSGLNGEDYSSKVVRFVTEKEV